VGCQGSCIQVLFGVEMVLFCPLLTAQQVNSKCMLEEALSGIKIVSLLEYKQDDMLRTSSDTTCTTCIFASTL